MAREYRVESEADGNRAEDEIEKWVKATGADIRKNSTEEVDFTVWANGVPLYHIEVEHKKAYALPRIKKEGMRWLQHKVDKYCRYDLKVYYAMVLNDWSRFWFMEMIDIFNDGELVECETDGRVGMGKCYLIKLDHPEIHERKL